MATTSAAEVRQMIVFEHLEAADEKAAYDAATAGTKKPQQPTDASFAGT